MIQAKDSSNPDRASKRTQGAKTWRIALLFTAACFVIVAILTREPAFILIGIFPALASLSQC